MYLGRTRDWNFYVKPEFVEFEKNFVPNLRDIEFIDDVDDTEEIKANRKRARKAQDTEFEHHKKYTVADQRRMREEKQAEDLADPDAYHRKKQRARDQAAKYRGMKWSSKGNSKGTSKGNSKGKSKGKPADAVREDADERNAWRSSGWVDFKVSDEWR